MKVCAFVCMKPLLKNNDVDLMENKPKMGLFSLMILHKILVFHEIFNIIYTKDTSMLVKILVFADSLQNYTSIFCRRFLNA